MSRRIACAFAELVVADDQHRTGFEFVGAAHLAFQAARFAFHLDADALLAQSMDQRESPVARLGADPGDVNRRGRRARALLHAQQHRQPLDAHGKTNAGNRRPAQLLHQTVVASAGRHRALGAEQRRWSIRKSSGNNNRDRAPCAD